MTQIILSSLDSDEVSSINDTTEALQVANIIKTTYNDIMSRANLPEHYIIAQLNDSGNASWPTLMRRPTDVEELLWIKYNKRTSNASGTDEEFEDVKYLPFDVFTQRMNQLNESDTNVISYSFTDLTASDTFVIKGYNDKAPDYWTTWDDYYYLFDSYNDDVDTTLQKSKTQCYVLKKPSFTLSDNFTPDMDGLQFSLLLNEAKSTAFFELKQMQHQKAEKNARRAWITMERTKNASRPKSAYYYDDLPNYGRK